MRDYLLCGNKRNGLSCVRIYGHNEPCHFKGNILEDFDNSSDDEAANPDVSCVVQVSLCDTTFLITIAEARNLSDQLLNMLGDVDP